MALQTKYQTQFGLTIDNAYCRIVSYTGDRLSIRTDLLVYVSKEAKDTGYQSIGFLSTLLDLQYGATMQEMYDALKLQEPFINSIDV